MAVFFKQFQALKMIMMIEMVVFGHINHDDYYVTCEAGGVGDRAGGCLGHWQRGSRQGPYLAGSGMGNLASVGGAVSGLL